jgi:2-methylcitrate dehydratase PrpD
LHPSWHEKEDVASVATLVNGLMIMFFDLNDTYFSKQLPVPSL